MKKRLDQLLVDVKEVSSKEYAKKLILLSCVRVNDNVCTKPGMKFSEDVKIDIIGDISPKYVSRGGFKLEAIIEQLEIDVKDKVCIDIGASTGGFTDCLLQNGAKKVYCIDVGYGQLAYKLRTDERVRNFEKQNIRHFDCSNLDEKIDIAVCDVSFISFGKIKEKIHEILSDDSYLLYLIKPQFEAGKDNLKKGIVKDRKIHLSVIEKTFDEALESNLFINYLTYSPIKGPKGNIEFLAKISKNSNNYNRENIKMVVDKAWSNLKK